MRRAAPLALAICVILSVATVGFCAPCQAEQCCGACDAAPSASDSTEPVQLDEDTVDVLRRQFEEEGMAKELYLAFYEKWGLRPFHNIATRGETHHAAAVRAMLEAADVEIPETKTADGKYADPEAQKFRDRLMKQGLESLEGAIRAGLEFEEHDIKTLREDAESCSSERVVELLQMLEVGSKHHLGAFHRHASMRGVAYEPKHLSEAEFAEALGLGVAEDAETERQPAGDASGGGSKLEEQTVARGQWRGPRGRMRARRGR